MIVVLSPASVASHNVMDEVSYALDEGKLVVPILLRSCAIPFRLRRVQYIDFTASYNTGFSQLLRALGEEQKRVMLDVSFLSGEEWDGRRDVAMFGARVGAKNVLCAVSLEALVDHFRADPRQPLATFRQHRATIEELARRLIQAQRFEADGSILIRSQDR
jgi:hypothetical protein